VVVVIAVVDAVGSGGKSVHLQLSFLPGTEIWQ